MRADLLAWCRFAYHAPGAELPKATADASLARCLIANRVGPMVARALRTAAGTSAATGQVAAAPPRVIDKEFAALVRDDARLAAERALLALSALRHVADPLGHAGIDWMLWKGPALAAQVWGDPACRHCSDLDIVVAPAAMRAARDALATAGWRSRDGLSRAQERAIHGATAAVPLVRDDPQGSSFLVELHERFAARHYPAPVDVARALAGAQVVTVGGTAVRTPAGADALLLLALHATKHGWSQAEEVLSFARLAERDPESLARASANAEAAGVGRAVRLACGLARELLGIRLDHAERTDADDAGLAECLARMVAGDGGWRETHAWTIRWMSRRPDRARYLVRALLSPTPQEWRWLRLPDAFVGAYPAVRVARLALRAIGLAR